MGPIVDLSDPRWPSLREAARRLLREDGCSLLVPEKNIDDAWKIVQLIADHVPSKVELPRVSVGQLSIDGFAQIGGEEPPLAICWVPECGWDDFARQVVDLLEAGYPGCVGCGGPGAEGDWNEAIRRSKFLPEFEP